MLERNLTMKILLLCVVLSISLATFGISLVCAQNSDATNKDGIEQDVRNLNAEEVAAFLNNDPKAMARVWSDDFVVTNPLNKFVSKQQVLGMVQSGFLVITSYDRRIEYVRVYSDTVIVAGSETVVWGGKMPNAGKTEHLRFTGVWMKQQGRFQEVARHANVVPQ
jgi:ketosteroid isomerase-like protein